MPGAGCAASDIQRAVAHATRGGECGQEGGERGYYHLHRNLNQALLLHCLLFSLVLYRFAVSGLITLVLA